MYKKLIIELLVSFLFSFISGLILIPVLRKIKCGQPVLKYVELHKGKEGTPTMGGVFFILPSAIVFLIFGKLNGRLSLYSLTLSIAFMIVGLLDDFLKIKYKKNEGLKAYQKIIFQCTISVVAGIFCYRNGITYSVMPFANKKIDLGIFTLILVPFIFIAMTNSVNLTDGLDGLCGNVSMFYLLILFVLINVQQGFDILPKMVSGELNGINMLIASFVGGILAFLAFNTGKASVFMGDTGSLSLGGLLGAISIFSFNAFYIPVVGIMFVLSTTSVIIQVLYYKKTKKRIFLMSPYHHHLQMKGYSENKITYIYSLITVIMGLLCIISYF